MKADFVGRTWPILSVYRELECRQITLEAKFVSA